MDPSGFTLPYDFLLLAGLAEALDDVAFLTRPPRSRPAEDYPEIPGARVVKSFYPLAEAVRKRVDRALVYGPIKAVEHYLGLRKVLKRVEREQIDVVHLQWMVLPKLDQKFVRSLQSRGVAVVHTVHDTQPFHGSPTASIQVDGWLDTLKMFDRLIVHTEQSADTLVELGLRRERMTVIPHGVIPLGDQDPKPSASRTYAPDDSISLLFFGLIKPYKGVDVLLEAFAKVPQEIRRGSRLKIAGNPIEVPDDLEKMARTLGIGDSVEFDLRFVPDSEVPGMLKAADVVVFPYRRIDASGIFMSVLPYGKPLVASGVGMFEEYITSGENGVLVPPGDVDALAEALTTLLEDRTSLTDLATAAALRAREVPSWAEIGRKTAALYASLAADGRPT